MKYLPRLIDKKIASYLKIFGAVLVEGPKYSGKTSSCLQVSKTHVFLQNPADKIRFDELMAIDPRILLNGEYPILLDEWQDYPQLWDAVRFDIDQKQIKGGFLLTGSASSRQIKTMHTGTGRIGRLLMRPMSLYESQHTQTTISLASLFANLTLSPHQCDLRLEDYMSMICRGGFPGSRLLNDEDAIIATHHYTDELKRLKIASSLSKRKALSINDRMLQSIARNLLTTVSFDKIRQEVTSQGLSLTTRTIYNYYEKLKNYFIIEDVEAWNPHIRSRARLTKIPKRNFIDPSIAIGALNLKKESLMSDLNYYGFLFESLCLRDLRILASELDGEVFYYADNTQLDIDAIIQLKDGRWGAIQIKVGSAHFEDAASDLDRFVEKLDYKKIKKPSFLMILTGTRDAYKRPDGKFVVPLGLLKP
jgi:predicted AAA+ superfamily ATPase